MHSCDSILFYCTFISTFSSKPSPSGREGKKKSIWASWTSKPVALPEDFKWVVKLEHFKWVVKWMNQLVKIIRSIYFWSYAWQWVQNLVCLPWCACMIHSDQYSASNLWINWCNCFCLFMQLVDEVQFLGKWRTSWELWLKLIRDYNLMHKYTLLSTSEVNSVRLCSFLSWCVMNLFCGCRRVLVRSMMLKCSTGMRAIILKWLVEFSRLPEKM